MVVNFKALKSYLLVSICCSIMLFALEKCDEGDLPVQDNSIPKKEKELTAKEAEMAEQVRIISEVLAIQRLYGGSGSLP